ARLLAAGCGAAQTRGFRVDGFGFNADSGPWAAFLQLASADRGASPFNVSDLFCRAAGLEPRDARFSLRRPDSGALARADELLSGRVPSGSAGLAALQLGASEDRRRWPISHFAELAQGLWDVERVCPVLLGSGQEAGLAGRFAARFQGPVLDLTGATDLAELAAVLTRCRILVSNDTGTMHLAAGLGVPVAAIFLATAQPWDTGPYQEGALCIEPDLDCHPCQFGRDCERGEACRRAVEPGPVLDLVRPMLYGRAPERAARPGLRAWLAKRDRAGFMGLESVSGHGDQDRCTWIAVQRLFYRRFLDGKGFSGLRPRAPGPILARTLVPALNRAGEMLGLIIQQGALVAKNPRPGFKAKLISSCRRLKGLFQAEPRLGLLGALWEFESQQVPDRMSGLLDLAGRYLGLVKALAGALESSGMEIEGTCQSQDAGKKGLIREDMR
ncbi:MAG: glycosyltransferase family 9 protein, partial [Desulfovibrionaceae bacterium]|nr:glycosyltransferase family 9 protein [Desulfovibrionaceae bacterium]